MWDPTRVRMANGKLWYHQFSTLCLKQALLIDKHPLSLLGSDSVSQFLLTQYCRQTGPSYLSWKLRENLFTHLSYRLSPRCHQGNEEGSVRFERNIHLSVCSMNSSWFSILNGKSPEGMICLQLSMLWTKAWAVHQRCHPLEGNGPNQMPPWQVIHSC